MIENSPKAIILNERLFNTIQFMHEYTIREKIETAGFIIKQANGSLTIVSQITGEKHSVEMETNEQLQTGESFIGYMHCHPNTDYFSMPDIATFLSNPSEQVSILSGNNGINHVLIRTLFTEGISLNDAKGFVDAYEMDQINEIAQAHKFLHYSGKLRMLNNELKTENDNVVQLDDLIKNVKGLPQIPSDSIIPKKSGLGALDQREFIKRIYY